MNSQQPIENLDDLPPILWIGKMFTKMGLKVLGEDPGSLEEGHAYPCLTMELPVNPDEYLDQRGWFDLDTFDRHIFDRLNPFDRLIQVYYTAYPLAKKLDEFWFFTDKDTLRFQPSSGSLDRVQPKRPQPERAAKLADYQRDLAQISAYLQALFPNLAEEGTPIQAPTEEAIQIALYSLPSGYFRI